MRYVALLRGINVGGHGKVEMPRLKTVRPKWALTVEQAIGLFDRFDLLIAAAVASVQLPNPCGLTLIAIGRVSVSFVFKLLAQGDFLRNPADLIQRFAP